ncbi:TldD/PmbA family protein [Marivibrio halodurans]|uniref:TldD/PmbA family protein n=1 Tax=Marivibrio halodurans TaxID=2039722 RepID=A0A8J7SQ95_9PROT|nr:TldD/PmbA family protein [Marivibrio halodurans]MBP5858906.1 TldD/PmbA family protein [Marivibrio halodurans]
MTDDSRTGADQQSLDLIEEMLERARKAGADQADAIVAHAISLSHAQRLGKVEQLERSESRDLGLRVIIGKQQACVSGNDWKPDALAELVERAIAMAGTVPDDPYCGLAEEGALGRPPFPDVDGCDPVEPAAELLIERAKAAEEAALAVDGVTNSEGAESSWARWSIALGASNGFRGGYENSRHGVGVSVLAGEGVAMESDHDFTSKVHGADLEDPTAIGRKAGELAVAKLNPRKGPTRKCPVVFDPRVSNSMLRHLAGAINGSAIARGTSFLKDRMGERVMAAGLTVIDDPHRPRGLASKPFDAEGIATARRALVEDGILKSWVLDLRTARQLDLESTGHAGRGTSSPPSPGTTNLYLAPGARSRADLIGEIEDGFYVTSLMGMGVNGVTGDYSRGASGFWIEKGEITYPVSEMTIAGNLKDMFLGMEAADDLDFRYGTNAPTLRIQTMTVAGQ